MTSLQPLRSSVAFLALAAHNAEEALYARDWALANVGLLNRYTTTDLAAIWAGPAFRFALLGLTLALLALSVVAARAPRRGVAVYVLLGYATKRGGVIAATIGIALYASVVSMMVSL